ncbi:hypothetical protein K491DRAFT_135129 [Lophiostoma macrostomum CBS 122681]|uniref:Uncharacterized protein n=1 Tax=Lophiostoma macrostomum CBS 122681 TaxID=1314788 RepID=A0A6A6TMF8_9PLEO|nr:hypothetical protein K491DRAFT_135129 [Lophiostoma macrostomum CBS 122681]
MEHERPGCEFSSDYQMKDQQRYKKMEDPLRNVPWKTFQYAFTKGSKDWHRHYWKSTRKDSASGSTGADEKSTCDCSLYGDGECSHTCLQIRKLREYRDWLVRDFLHWPEQNTIVIIPHQKTEPLRMWRDPGGPLGNAEVYAGHYIWLTEILGCARLDVPAARLEYDPKNPEALFEYEPFWISVLAAPGTDLMLIRAVAMLFEKRAQVDSWKPEYWPSHSSSAE